MNKSNMINIIRNETGCDKKKALSALDAILEGIVEALANKEEVKLINFGTFRTKHRAEKKGRNPQTKEDMIIPARTVAVFTPGQKLKDAVK